MFEIRWNNIFGVLLMIVALYILGRFSHAVTAFLDMVSSIGEFHRNPDDRLVGMLTLCVAATIILIALKLIFNRGDRP